MTFAEPNQASRYHIGLSTALISGIVVGLLLGSRVAGPA